MSASSPHQIYILCNIFIVNLLKEMKNEMFQVFSNNLENFNTYNLHTVSKGQTLDVVCGSTGLV